MSIKYNSKSLPKLTYSIAEACAVTGLSRGYFHKLFNEHKLTRCKVGKRTFILADELEAYLRTRPSDKWTGGGLRSVTSGSEA